MFYKISRPTGGGANGTRGSLKVDSVGKRLGNEPNSFLRLSLLLGIALSDRFLESSS